MASEGIITYLDILTMSNELKNFLVLIRHGQSEWNEKNLFTG